MVHLMFRIDIGFDENRGYAAVVLDVPLARQKGLRASSPEQLASRLRRVLIDEMSRQRHFPLESEPARKRAPEVTETDS